MECMPTCPDTNNTNSGECSVRNVSLSQSKKNKEEDMVYQKYKPHPFLKRNAQKWKAVSSLGNLS